MVDKSQFYRGTLEGCILKIINDDEVYGYEIAERLKNYGLDGISEGTIYPLLLRLKRNGLIDSVKKASPFGPKRKYYSLSSLGKQELNDFYNSWLKISDSINEIFANYKKD